MARQHARGSSAAAMSPQKEQGHAGGLAASGTRTKGENQLALQLSFPGSCRHHSVARWDNVLLLRQERQGEPVCVNEMQNKFYIVPSSALHHICWSAWN